MLFKEIKHEFEIDGRKCSFEAGKLALNLNPLFLQEWEILLLQ